MRTKARCALWFEKGKCLCMVHAPNPVPLLVLKSDHGFNANSIGQWMALIGRCTNSNLLVLCRRFYCVITHVHGPLYKLLISSFIFFLKKNHFLFTFSFLFSFIKELLFLHTILIGLFVCRLLQGSYPCI